MSIEIKISKKRISYKKAMLFLSKRVEEVKNDKVKEFSLHPIGHVMDPVCNPHTDPDADPDSILTSSICYLSKGCCGGTGLYYNKLLKTYTVYVTNPFHLLSKTLKEEGLMDQLYSMPIEEAANIIESNLKEIYRKQYPRQPHHGCINDTNEHFELIHFCPMKFNRMIVFDGDMLHAMYGEDKHMTYFKTHERMTTKYFIPRHKPEKEMIF